ncbi:hypothetical protein [Paragemmobacter straminiformis]|uniref:Uncharacterized protein n=1 Tax=Paragemmobacter straminiformis TaxID=2045119 RepID=A0A842I6S8_9RHOB|nr:hypothetical protein [Gemmobacter straminiformis]MBC2834668.1 hypothetical protein [Gemmobacter straminiformis]
MLWDIRTQMKPALAVIDLIPNIHRTPALAALRRAVLEGRPATFRLTDEERELAFHDAHVQLTSPIGARVLRALYDAGHLKLKKPATKSLPALDAYIATEAAFRAEVARLVAADDARRSRLAEIIADPACARPDELTVDLVDKVISARHGYAATGTVTIAGLPCHRSHSSATAADDARYRSEASFRCWWIDSAGQRQGDAG